MSFTCYPIIITKVEDKPLPSINSILSDILETSCIPIRVISDKNDLVFKDIQKGVDFEVQYIIVTIKYLKEFST